MYSNVEWVLKTILDCGLADLSMLESVEYDVCDIVEELLEDDIRPTLDEIFDRVFRMAAQELDDLVLEELHALQIRLGRPESDSEKEELEDAVEQIRKLLPKRDMRWYLNCLDTHVYFDNNREIYRDYVPHLLEKIEQRTGFPFELS